MRNAECGTGFYHWHYRKPGAWAGRGRFPDGLKWRVVAQPGGTKYVICNGDEGDGRVHGPDDFGESFPFRVLKDRHRGGGGGAHEGVFTSGNEHPLAVKRVTACDRAVGEARWLGRSFWSRFQLKLGGVRRCGAFVCGEKRL